jgi:hypothetical protein
LPLPKLPQEYPSSLRIRSQRAATGTPLPTVNSYNYAPENFLSKIAANPRPPSWNSVCQMQALYNLTYILATAQSLICSPFMGGQRPGKK